MAKIFAALGQESFSAQVFFLFAIVCGFSLASLKTLEWKDLEPSDESGEPNDTAALAITTDQRALTLSQLSPILVRRLYQLPRSGPAVFYPHREEGCYWSPVTARLNWGRICVRAKLPGLKLRDVRFTWAQWTARQDNNQCRQLEAVIDRATVRMYQSMQPPVPMKTTRVVPMNRKMEMRRKIQPLQRNRLIKTEWPG
jgi:hypothetical protein